MARLRPPSPGRLRYYGTEHLKDVLVEGMTIETLQRVSGALEVHLTLTEGKVVLRGRPSRRVIAPSLHYSYEALSGREANRDAEVERLKVKIEALSNEIRELRAKSVSRLRFFSKAFTLAGLGSRGRPVTPPAKSTINEALSATLVHDVYFFGNAEQRRKARSELSDVEEVPFAESLLVSIRNAGGKALAERAIKADSERAEMLKAPIAPKKSTD